PLFPTLWFRKRCVKWIARPNRASVKPQIRQIDAPRSTTAAAAAHSQLGEFVLYCEGDVPLLFTENEPNHEGLFHTQNESAYVKDGINDYVVQGSRGTVNPART